MTNLISILILFLSSLSLFMSCEFSTPTINGDSTSGKVNLRSIRVECKEESICTNNETSNFEARAIYLNDKCDENLVSPMSIIATSVTAIKCDTNRSCSGMFKVFKSADGIDDEFIVSQNEVNLLVYIDVNLNETLDIGEPVNCNEDVSLRIKNNKSDISINIKRLY